MRSSHRLERIDTAFDGTQLVADAGLLLPATLLGRLGLRELVDRHADLGPAPGRANAGDKVASLVLSALAGGDCIDDANALRAGGTDAVLGFRAKAASTLGTFLRSFGLGNVRQLDRVSRELLGRAFAAGAGPGAGPLTIDGPTRPGHASPSDGPRARPNVSGLPPVRGRVARRRLADRRVPSMRAAAPARGGDGRSGEDEARPRDAARAARGTPPAAPPVRRAHVSGRSMSSRCVARRHLAERRPVGRPDTPEPCAARIPTSVTTGMRARDARRPASGDASAAARLERSPG